MPGIDYTIGARISGFSSGISAAMGKLRGLATGVARIAGPVAAVAGIGSLTAAFGKAIGKAAEMESLQTAFQPLLGSAEAARERIAELAAFAASTPFELPEVAAASKTLETLTRGALATGDGLRLVGDVASATGQPFEAIATTIGRLYDGLESGRPVGEALARLQELGVVSGDTRSRLEALQEQGVKGAEAWAVAEAAMGRFSGGMKLQSGTWAGLMSTLKDNIGQAFAAFGAPILDVLRPYLASAADTAGKLAAKAAEFGQKVAGTVRLVAAAFQTGNLTTIIATSLRLAFINSVNFLWKTLRASISAAGQYIVECFKNAVAIFQIITTADFWKGMGNALIGIFLDAVGFLQKGLAEALEIARPLAELFGKGDQLSGAQDALRESAGFLREQAADKYSRAGDQLAPAAAKIAERLAEAGTAIAQRFQDTFEATGDVIDPTAARKTLTEAFGEIRDHAAAQAAAAKAAKEAIQPATPATGEDTPAASPAVRQIAADRLRQVGGYVGASLSSARDKAAEKTEQWTRKTAEATARIAKALTRQPATASPAGAVF